MLHLRERSLSQLNKVNAGAINDSYRNCKTDTGQPIMNIAYIALGVCTFLSHIDLIILVPKCTVFFCMSYIYLTMFLSYLILTDNFILVFNFM